MNKRRVNGHSRIIIITHAMVSFACKFMDTVRWMFDSSVVKQYGGD